MMRTLILAINAKYVHSALAPWYLKAAVRAKNAETRKTRAVFLREPEILETHINRPPEEILAAIVEARPEILAISCYIWNMDMVGKLLAEIPGLLPGCILLLGGPEVSFDCEERLFAFPMVDYIIRGEGEEPFVRLLSLLEEARREPASAGDFREKEALAAVCGLTWRRRDGRIVQNPGRVYGGEPPDPFLPEYMAQVKGRLVYLETSRGCPFHCGFCLSERGGVRFFPLERAKRDMLRLANSGAKTVKLVDRTFNCHSRRCRELIRFLTECRADGRIPPGLCFHLEAAADLFDRKSIEMLENAPAGLFQLEIGLQSFHEGALKLVGRETDLGKAGENIRRLREKNNMHLHLDLIAGLPGEDHEAFGSSFDQAFALRPHMLQLGFLKLLRGSRLRAQSGDYGIVFDPEPPYRVRKTAWLGEAELEALALCEDALERMYNSGRFPETCAYLLEKNALPADAGAEADGRLSPFRLFSALGSFIGKTAGMSLETYIAGLLDFGAACFPAEADKEALRDCLVIDWLQTNHVGVLPLCLQKKDRRNAAVGRAIENMWKKEKSALSPGQNRGTRREYGFGLLYGGGKVRAALADYRRPRPYLGNYPLRIFDAGEDCIIDQSLI